MSDYDIEVEDDEPQDELTGLRASFSFIVYRYQVEEIVQILSEVISDESYVVAQRTGDYNRAAELAIIARYLGKLNQFIANFDPTPE